MADETEHEITTDILIQIRDEIRSMRDSFEQRFDAMEVRLDRIDAAEERNEQRFEELFGRFNTMASDLKRFAGIVNETILHYADEMDTVRDRLGRIESRLGIPYRSE